MRRSAIIDFLDYLLIVLIILDTNTVYSCIISQDFHIPETTGIVLVFIMIVLFLQKREIKRSLLKKICFFFVTYYCVMAVMFVFSVESKFAMSYIARFIVIFPLLVVYICMQIQQNKTFALCNKYVNIMTCLGIISLFFWIFGSQLHVISPTGSVLVRWGADVIYPSFYGLYFERQKVQFLFYDGLRNQGIFSEGPMYSLCLVIAIAIELFLRQYFVYSSRSVIRMTTNRSKGHHLNSRLILLIITLLTTFTTTGQILLIVMLVLKFALARPKLKENQIFKLIALLFFAAIGGYTACNIFLMKSQSMSWKIRADDLRAGFQAWLSSPIFGRGFNDLSVLNPFKGAVHTVGTISTSNSITTVLAQGGLLLFLVYSIPIFSGIRFSIKQNQPPFLAFIIVFLFEFTFTVFPYQFLMLFILAILYSCLIMNYGKQRHDDRRIKLEFRSN